MTITHMPHLDAIAREGEQYVALQAAWHLGFAEAERAAEQEQAMPFRFPSCEPWCNDHHLSIDRAPGRGVALRVPSHDQG